MKLRLAIFFTLVAATVTAAYFFRNSTTSQTTGANAIEQLKADGSYDSLAAAMTAARYRVERDGERLSAENPAQKLAATFEPDGALSIASSEHSTIFRIASFGRGDDQTEVGAGRWTATELRAENRRADVGLTEYVENRPEGVEQGFIIDAKPSGDAPLSLILKTSGGLIASATADGQRVILKNDVGAEVLAYEKLRVWDANNLELTARMTTTEGAIKLEVEDAAAVYPLTIDPTFVQAQILYSQFREERDYFGASVAISGNTIAVGAPNATVGTIEFAGAVFVFVKSGTVWNLQARITPPDVYTNGKFGDAVAISGDRLVVGAPEQNYGAPSGGTAYIFARTGNLWQVQERLLPTTPADSLRFGKTVAISGDTAVVGAPNTPINGNAAQGAVYVYVYSGGTWPLQARLTLSSGSPEDRFGDSVAISGNLLIAGCTGEDFVLSTDRGAAYVFSRTGTTWSSPVQLAANDGNDFQHFGRAVDIANSLSGPVAVVGAPEDSSNGFWVGSIYVFERSQIGIWSQTAKGFLPDGPDDGQFGKYVAISPLGNTIAVGNEHNDGRMGGFVFRRSNSSWVLQQRIYGSDQGRQDFQFGYAVDLSGDTVVFGAPRKRAAYVYSLGQKPFDFDGDGKTDFSIYRPNGNQWWFNRSSDLVTNVVNLGAAGDRLVPGDYTGDGKVDQAVWRPSTGFWFVVRSNDGSFFSFPFGASGDIPAPADYDGDGVTDPAVFRPSNATWYISRSSDSGTTIATFGASADKPVPADYDGDNKADIAIFRPNGPNGAEWWYSRSSNGVTSALQFGAATDKAVPGDFTGDGKADIAFFRPSNGNWFVLRSEDNSYFSFPFGTVGDVPAPADYDGDGRLDAAVYRPSTATWYAQPATTNTIIAQFGASGDQPLPNAFVP